MKSALLALILFAAQAIAQCPPGKSCPIQPPAKSSPATAYVFRSASGNPAPWATAVRISVVQGNARQIGSGTVIDSGPDSTLVMTAAHVLRAPAGSPIVVEIFAGTIDRKTGSLGRPVGSYPGEAIDRDDALDVGLLRFRPGKLLGASPLVPASWTPSPSDPLCSVGCSRGADPTAVSERFTAEQDLSGDGGAYRGLECDRRPSQGRSGGGLFDQLGRLAGVCDFAETDVPRGLYAHPDSLRSILRRNGLVELAEGVSRKAPQVAPSPFQSPAEPAPTIPTPPPSIAAEAAQVGGYLMPILAGLGGIGGTSIVAMGISLLKGRGQTPALDPVLVKTHDLGPLQPPAPEDLVKLLRKALADADAKKAAQEADAELLAKVRTLIAAPTVPNE